MLTWVIVDPAYNVMGRATRRLSSLVPIGRVVRWRTL